MKKLLLIEDDIFLAKVYKSLLEKEGHKVTVLNNGSEAVQTAREEKPGLIILDLVMPEKDGFTTLKELKGDQETKNIPVYVVSMLSTEEDIDKVMKMGAAKYITKTGNTFKGVIKQLEEEQPVTV